VTTAGEARPDGEQTTIENGCGRGMTRPTHQRRAGGQKIGLYTLKSRKAGQQEFLKNLITDALGAENHTRQNVKK